VMIEGISPLQMHRFTDAAVRQLLTGESAKVLAGQRPEPDEAAREVAYLNDDGSPYLPINNLFQCIMEAGKHLKYGRGKWTTTKSSKIPAVMEVVSPNHGALGAPVMRREEGNLLTGTWEPQCFTPANATGGKSACWRPVFFHWLIPFKVRVDTDYMPMQTARQLIDAAGKWEGLGPMRPSRKGLYGRFVVAEWKPLNT